MVTKLVFVELLNDNIYVKILPNKEIFPYEMFFGGQTDTQFHIQGIFFFGGGGGSIVQSVVGTRFS